MLPVMAHLLVQAALAGFFLVADPHRRTADEEANPDWPASGVLLGFAVLTVLVAASWHIGAARPPFAGAMALMLAGLAYRYAPAAPAAAGAVLVTLGTMLFWPLAREAGAEPRNLFPDVFGASPRPEAVETYLGFAAGLTAMIAAASLWRIARGRALPLATAAWYVGAATVGPLLVLVVAYWRVTGFDRSISFAVVAALLAAAFAGAAGWLRRMEEPDAAPIDGVRLALGATASAAIAALAAGLTFALDKGMLTVAFALAALGTAWVADRTALPILRYVVGAIGIVVLARLAYDPTIAGGETRHDADLQLALVGLRRAGAVVLPRQPPPREERPRPRRALRREPLDRVCGLPGVLRDPALAAGRRSLRRDLGPSRARPHGDRWPCLRASSWCGRRRAGRTWSTTSPRGCSAPLPPRSASPGSASSRTRCGRTRR